MAEPENTQRPPEPATISPEASRPFDVPAHDRTVSYPDRPTITFAGTPDNGDAPTRTNHGNAQEYEFAEGEPRDPDLPDVPGYRLIRVLGQGGMGTVYKSLHLALKRVVALKLSHCSPNSHTRPQHDVEFRTRFEREKTILAKLDHPNVVPIYDAGFWQGVPYLTMKFVTGKTLAHHLGELRNNLRDAAALLAKVAHAIDYLHTKGIVHRDIKPLNILVSLEGTPYVADLGLVREMADDSEFSISIIPLGTKQYMSPEQTRGGRENYTPACDIWAFGITLYELLAGERPFADTDQFELFRKIRHDAIPAIPAERGIPASLEAIACKCLQKSIADRYATAGEIARDLERWLAGEEIPMPGTTASATPLAYLATPAPKPKRRVRWSLAIAALLTVLGFSGILPAPVPQPKELTIAEKLEKGETVWLIGEKGPPNYPTARVQGWDSVLNLELEGCCTLTTAEYGAAMLVNVPFKKPMTLELEIAFSGGLPNAGSWGGVFVAKQNIASPGGEHDTFLGVIKQPVARVANGQQKWQANRTLDLIWSHKGVLLDRTELGGFAVDWNPQPRQNRVLDWDKVRVVFAPNEITAYWNDQEIGSATEPEPTQLLQAVAHRLKQNIVFPRVIDGYGIGILGSRSNVAVRKMCLIPTP